MCFCKLITNKVCIKNYFEKQLEFLFLIIKVLIRSNFSPETSIKVVGHTIFLTEKVF